MAYTAQGYYVPDQPSTGTQPVGSTPTTQVQQPKVPAAPVSSPQPTATKAVAPAAAPPPVMDPLAFAPSYAQPYGMQATDVNGFVPNAPMLAPAPPPQPPGTGVQTSPNSYQTFPTPYTGGYNANPVSMAREEGGYQYGSNGTRRPILGVDQTYGTPVYGDWEDVNQVGQFDPNTGAALWRGGDAYTQGQYQTRQDIANMSEAQRQSAFDALLAKYGGSLSQGNAGVALPSTASADDAAAFNYLQQLTNAAKYSPDNLKALTSNSNIYNSPLTEAEAPEFFAKYGINDPNYRSPTPTPIDNGYRTIQGGQEFTDPALAMDAFNKIQEQMKAGGSGIFDALEPGGTWRPDAYQQWLATHPGADATTPGPGGGTGGLPGTGGGGGGGGVPFPGAGGGPDTGDGGGGLDAGFTPVNPETDLRNFTITPSALLDRFKLAQEQYGTFADATSPQYDAALRDAARAAAATGRLGSGMLRTSYGDLANTRARELTNQRDALFQQALLGSVQDAQMQFEDLMREQEYQTSAQDQAFRQAITAANLQEALTSGAFQRALQTLTAGQVDSPADAQQWMAKVLGDQSTGAGQAFALLMQGLAQGRNTNAIDYEKLAAIMRGGPSSIGNIPADQLPKPGQTIYDTPIPGDNVYA